MKDNFNATNELANYMKRQFNVQSGIGRIVHTYNNLELKEGTTIKENCDTFVKETDKLKMAVSMVRNCELIFSHNLNTVLNLFC